AILCRCVYDQGGQKRQASGSYAIAQHGMSPWPPIHSTLSPDGRRVSGSANIHNFCRRGILTAWSGAQNRIKVRCSSSFVGKLSFISLPGGFRISDAPPSSFFAGHQLLRPPTEATPGLIGGLPPSGASTTTGAPTCTRL